MVSGWGTPGGAVDAVPTPAGAPPAARPTPARDRATAPRMGHATPGARRPARGAVARGTAAATATGAPAATPGAGPVLDRDPRRVKSGDGPPSGRSTCDRRPYFFFHPCRILSIRAYTPLMVASDSSAPAHRCRGRSTTAPLPLVTRPTSS